jgi:hypothetical protein
MYIYQSKSKLWGKDILSGRLSDGPQVIFHCLCILLFSHEIHAIALIATSDAVGSNITIKIEKEAASQFQKHLAFTFNMYKQVLVTLQI